MSQQYPPTPSDESGRHHPPTRPEPAQPRPDFAPDQPTMPFQPGTPVFQPYPGQPAGGWTQPPPPPQPAPPSVPTPYGQAGPYAQSPGRQAQPQHPSPPQYDPRSGQYVQTTYGQGPYGQPVVYQTVVNTPVPVIAPKSTGAAYVLWFFLGALGVHQFYLGRTGPGVAYLLCTVLLGWTLIGLIPVGIALLVDLFLIPSYTRTANQRLTGYRF